MKPSDKTTTIEELKHKAKTFVEERNWQDFQTAKNLAISISLEANELLEHFQWMNDEEVAKSEMDKKLIEELRMELADIFSYILVLSEKLGIDLSVSYLEKLEKAKQKYPASEFNSKLSREEDTKKYQETKKRYRN